MQIYLHKIGINMIPRYLIVAVYREREMEGHGRTATGWIEDACLPACTGTDDDES